MHCNSTIATIKFHNFDIPVSELVISRSIICTPPSLRQYNNILTI
nr:MAG TPA: hypothetical protein [Bacteriophage sp.]